ncbi:Zinc carboxypeptidase [Chitinophaga rupis]|uniref:Zinc carboxypeptidase n=1 Tax=Chitinophaga rupis TaxID=573321 RepID=A0A1H8BEG3_9BACT|nr:M14 family metallopeptidase [Chitinophaga rupis]SEM80247.1 Zinc carboxypeptidase [Chitinophaga rupis]
MRKLLIAAACSWLIPLHTLAQDLTTRFERTQGRETTTYTECIDYYRRLDQRFPQIKLLEMGPTDAGYPLHLAIFSGQGNFDFNSLHQQNKRIILINNGIHPGEPDGIDASMLLLRDLALGKKHLPDNVVLAVIPIYNIGGALNRSPDFRVDQNGPDAFGSRGNAQNLDLNRDFIKADSKNARSFQQIYQLTDPDVFVDNHVSNGADYQHVLTLLSTQHNKLGGVMGDYLDKEFEPGLYKLMKARGYDLIPYVNHFGETPDSGWTQYFDGPRYSSGYAALFHTFGFVPETHMLKPYPQRVKATYELMECFIQFVSEHSAAIKSIRDQTKQTVKTQNSFPLEWKTDMNQHSTITFKGFAAGHKPSEVSGLPRLYYDRSKPYERQIPFYNVAEPGNFVQKPAAYVIPQGWWAVIDLLKNSNVQMQRLAHDTAITVEVYHITDYKTAARPYEKHYLHSQVKVAATQEKIAFRKGDYYIPLNQNANRYLIETLEPTGGDSFFAWNFFDAILAPKEGYSSYVFEDTAAEYLRQHPEVKAELEKRKATDTAFAHNASAQLDFVYNHSQYAEPGYLRYPVYRIK